MILYLIGISLSNNWVKLAKIAQMITAKSRHVSIWKKTRFVKEKTSSLVEIGLLVMEKNVKM